MVPGAGGDWQSRAEAVAKKSARKWSVGYMVAVVFEIVSTVEGYGLKNIECGLGKRV
jgi:hypothetical protein